VEKKVTNQSINEENSETPRENERKIFCTLCGMRFKKIPKVKGPMTCEHDKKKGMKTDFVS
jgi:hypothetical protein